MDDSFKSSLMLDQWDHLSLAVCEEVARDLSKELRGAFRFHKVGLCVLGNQQHQVAFFEWDGRPEGYDNVFFVLIPGGKATLGYDRDHPFVPNQQQKESWVDETERTGMFNGTLDALLDKIMTPLRQVTFQPFLLEVLARPLTPPPTFNETLGPSGGWEHHRTPISYEKTLRQISRQGCRFPTSDEREYACAAGSRTLFRWGNDTPDCYIPRIGSKDMAQWDAHLRENAFGLFIARNPYYWEFVMEREILRGGDGGTALHAGVGKFAAWLTLASAFYREAYPENTVLSRAYLRRSFSLP